MRRIKFKVFYGLNFSITMIESFLIGRWVIGLLNELDFFGMLCVHSLILFPFMLVHGYIYLIIHEESDLIEGTSKALRAEIKKNHQMKVEIKACEQKIENLKEEKKNKEEKLRLKNENLNLQCTLRQLENELNQEYQTCECCGTKASLKACFCPQCGMKFRKGDDNFNE